MRFPLLLCLLLLCSVLPAQSPTRVWLDTDIVIGKPGDRVREVDDGLALMLALKSPAIELVGISFIREVVYAEQVTKKLLDCYHEGPAIPLYPGADDVKDLGPVTPAVTALAEALQKERLTVLALGPMTNIATLLQHHPELAGQIDEIYFCGGRQPGHTLSPGLGKVHVGDYNFEVNVPAFQLVLDSGIPIRLAGFEPSASLFLGPIDIEVLQRGSNPCDAWLYETLRNWQIRGKNLFGVEGFIPYDLATLGPLIAPDYFLAYEDIPVAIKYRPDDRTYKNSGEEKAYLEASYNYPPTHTVRYYYRTLPGFEEQMIRVLAGREIELGK